MEKIINKATFGDGFSTEFIKTSTETPAVYNIISLMSRIDMKPPYQRPECWDKGNKKALIQSLINRVPIGSVHLVRKPNMRDTYWLMDGKQRISTIKRFRNNEFKIPVCFNEQTDEAAVPLITDPTKQYKELTFKDMKNHKLQSVQALADLFESANITVIKWDSMNFATQNKMFNQIQHQEPLGPYEEIYCGHYLTKMLFEWLVSHSTNRVLSKINSGFEQDIFSKATYMTHRMCLLAFGKDLEGTFNSASVDKNTIKKSVAILSKKMEVSNFPDTENNFTVDNFARINFFNNYNVLNDAITYFDMIIRSKRIDLANQALFIQDSIVFLIKLFQEKTIDFDITNTNNVQNIANFLVTYKDRARLVNTKGNKNVKLDAVVARFKYMTNLWQQISAPNAVPQTEPIEFINNIEQENFSMEEFVK